MGLDVQMTALATVLDLIRSGKARSKPELQRATGLGRTIVVERVAQLLASGLVREGELGASTGGRAARELQINAEAGVVLVFYLNLKGVEVGITDLSGHLLHRQHAESDFASGPEPLVERLIETWNRQLAKLGKTRTNVWGIGGGIPAHIDFASGTLIDSPSLPASWRGFPFRRHLSAPFGAPAWLDTGDNLLAIAELRTGNARDHENFIYVHADLALGCGIVTGGTLVRGAQGAAGNIGHIAAYGGDDALCRCGRRGCIEAVFGGEALIRKAVAAARSGESPGLRRQADIDLAAIGEAARLGDPFAIELSRAAGYNIGRILAATINVMNPALLIVGGRLLQTGTLFFAALREAILHHSLPFVTEGLTIQSVEHPQTAGLIGAANMVLDELFSPQELARWFAAGSPAVASPDPVAVERI